MQIRDLTGQQQLKQHNNTNKESTCSSALRTALLSISTLGAISQLAPEYPEYPAAALVLVLVLVLVQLHMAVQVRSVAAQRRLRELSEFEVLLSVAPVLMSMKNASVYGLHPASSSDFHSISLLSLLLLVVLAGAKQGSFPGCSALNTLT
jgi:hypothetical protein